MPADLNDYFNKKKPGNDNRGSSQNSDKEPPFKKDFKMPNLPSGFGKFGALIAAMFVVFGAIRLARFNVTTGTYEPNVFIGLPIPTAAIVSVLWVGVYLDYTFLTGFEWSLVLLEAVLAVLMVSNIRYPSFKKINLKQPHVIRILVALVVAFSMLYLYPFESATFVMSVYVLYGIVRATIMFSKNSKKKESE